MDNPFYFNGYYDAEHFCDRQKELEILLCNMANGVNTTLIAQRRMGKTGLIQRLFDELKHNGSDIQPIYVDIMATRDVADFNKALAEAIVNAYPEESPLGRRIWTFVKSLRPMMSFDQLTGDVQFQLSYQMKEQKESTLIDLLKMLENHEKPILLAIDEFQQIREYPEQNLEAVLRTHIQLLHNVTFIFCGSKKHMMIDIFSNPKKPFYQSTGFLALSSIEKNCYAEFITRQFASNGRTIDSDAVDFILQWSRCHTYYTQRVCNQTFLASNHATMDVVNHCCDAILLMQAPYFLQIRQLLTDSQWNYLIAVAKEEELERPYTSSFLNRYKIGSSPVSRRLLNALQDKDLIQCEVEKDRTYYFVGDVFLMRWLQREY